MTDGSHRDRSMDPERWRRIDAVFEAALDLRPAAREGYLDSTCAGDPALRREVERLLEHDERAGEFLESPAAVVGGGAHEGTGASGVVGETIGAYRVEREIAHGGMGAVYLATRADDEYRRQVAIKLLKPELESSGLVRRFRAERQILANLDHPNVARLFEGGTTADGRPYLVMEYIEGSPIDRYCDQRRLSVKARLELFRKVCSAVHYAHQNLVVHRDIKPANVLVTDDGEPRLVDFGIAKLLAPEAFAGTREATATGLRPMTLGYASPEQILGQPITTATDVYSLGVVLYELLCGRLPRRLAGRSLPEIERALTGEEPLEPSRALIREPPDAGGAEAGDVERTTRELSRARGARPQQLSRQLSGDLDNIVLMALRTEPAARYASVEQLSEDLERHLTGRPVLARRATLGYRVSRFLRRNKLAAAVAGLVLGLTLAFAAAMAKQAEETARQRDQAELERDKARRVSGFLVDLFKAVDPWESPGSDLTVRQVLDRGADKIERELEDQPEVRATLRHAIGSVYTHLGLYPQAGPHLEAALETRERLLGAEDPEIAESLFQVATLYRRQGEYAAAEPLYLRALEMWRETLGPDRSEVAAVHRSLSNLYRTQGRYAEAEEQALVALEIFERALGPDHSEVAGTLDALAGIHARQGGMETAERYLERALLINEKAAGENNLRTAAILSNLGILRLDRGAFDEAAASVERSLAIYQQVLVEDHPRVANALTVLANIRTAQGDVAAAEEGLRRALAIYEQALGGDHARVATNLHHLGRLLAGEGRIAEGEPLLERSLRIRDQVLGPDHPFVGQTLQALADLRAGDGRHAAAEPLYRRALEISAAAPSPQGISGLVESYAGVLRALGREAEAAALEARAAEAP